MKHFNAFLFHILTVAKNFSLVCKQWKEWGQDTQYIHNDLNKMNWMDKIWVIYHLIKMKEEMYSISNKLMSEVYRWGNGNLLYPCEMDIPSVYSGLYMGLGYDTLQTMTNDENMGVYMGGYMGLGNDALTNGMTFSGNIGIGYNALTHLGEIA